MFTAKGPTGTPKVVSSGTITRKILFLDNVNTRFVCFMAPQNVPLPAEHICFIWE